MLGEFLSSIIERPIWRERPATPGQALIELVILALHKNEYAQRRGIDIPIAYGEVCLSREEMAYRWKWSRNKVDYFLVRLKRYGWIHIRKTPIINVLTFFFSPFFKLYGTAESTAHGTTHGTTESTTESTAHGTTEDFFQEARIISDEKVGKYDSKRIPIQTSDTPLSSENQDFAWAMKLTNEALGIQEGWGGEVAAINSLQDYMNLYMNGMNGTAQNEKNGTAQSSFQKRKKQRQNERKEPKERKKETKKEKITNTISLGWINHKPKENCVFLNESAAVAATERDDDFLGENHERGMEKDSTQPMEKDSLQTTERTQIENQQNPKAAAAADDPAAAKIDKKAWKQELTRTVLEEIRRFTNDFIDNIEPKEDITRRCSTVCWHKVPVHHLGETENAYLYILYLRYLVLKCPNICASMKKLPTQQQYLQLVELFGHKLVNKKTDLLEGYCDRYHYKTLYQPLLDWCQREKQKK